MQRFRVTALRPVTLNVQMDDEGTLLQIELAAGASSVVRKVFRIPAEGEVPGVDIVPHPAEVGQKVRVGRSIELLRLA